MNSFIAGAATTVVVMTIVNIAVQMTRLIDKTKKITTRSTVSWPDS